MISDIDDGSAKGKRQFDITLTPAGYRMGLTPGTIAGKIRAAYQGIEAVKHQRGRNEITVRVRLAGGRLRSRPMLPPSQWPRILSGSGSGPLF